MTLLKRRTLALTTLSALTLSGFIACGGDSEDGNDSGNGSDSVGQGGEGTDSGLDGNGSGGTPGETRLDCDYPPSLEGDVLEAVAYGNVTKSKGTPEKFIAAALATLRAQNEMFDADLAALFQLDADGSPNDDSLTSISWGVNHDAVLLGSTLGMNTPLFVANAVVDSADPPEEATPLGVIGRLSKTPYVVLASSPFRTTNNAQMDQFVDNTIRHLTKTSDGDPLDITLAHLTEGYWFPDESGTRAWLTARFGGDVRVNAEGACDDDALAGCLKDTDLLVISQDALEDSDVEAVREQVADALADGVPVLYFSFDGTTTKLGDELLELFRVRNAGDNYWSKYTVVDFDPSTLIGGMSSEQSAIRAMLERLDSGEYDFTLATAQTDAVEPTYLAQFGTGATAVRSMMSDFDRKGVDIFTVCGNEVPKLLALLGDRLRQDISYPMSTAATPTVDFLRAYYADHAVLNVRSFAPAQPDRGDFDTTDPSGVKPVTRRVKLTSRPYFRSTGAYALPGRVMKVTRRDDADTPVRVFVNSLRSSSTHEWEDDNFGGYSRPKYLQSTAVPLVPGQSVVFTSVYGGPVQIGFDESGIDVELEFEDVGEHPHWSSSADDERFAKGIEAAVYDWIEVETEAFEVHSKRAQFLETMQDARWNTPTKLTSAIEKYTFDATHVVSGFRGKGITSVPEIVDWAEDKGFEIPNLDLVKHGNFDKATCGWGCSGNPYDAGWSFSPIGHGDIHELGHSLQNGRFQISYGAATHANHSVTNWFPFYVANAYFDDHGGDTSDWDIDHEPFFVELQAAYAAGERSGTFSTRLRDYMEDQLTPSADDGIRLNYSFLMQVMMMAHSKGKLENGYHLVARLHILDRAFRAATSDETTWAAAKDALGFGSFTLDEAKTISNNDFMGVGICASVELDYRDYFDMFGFELSTKAKTQIEGFGHASVERAYWALDPLGHNHGALSTKTSDFQKITIDGTTAWPF